MQGRVVESPVAIVGAVNNGGAFSQGFLWRIYRRSGNYRVFRFSRICDFGTFYEV